MRALVTGAAGFVGRHTVAVLQERGWDVDGNDIRDGADALALFRECTTRYDLVVHAAASSPHRAAIDNEPRHFAKNLLLDAAMFDWAARTRQYRVVYLSSSAVYPVNLQKLDWTHGGDGSVRVGGCLAEDDVNPSAEAFGAPDSVYGWTKLTGELLAEQARRADVPVTVVRPFSGYGSDQSAHFPFTAIFRRAVRRDDPLYIWGDGTQVRDWIHIDDVVSGMLAVVANGIDGPVNLCTGVGTSMSELAEMACREVGYTPTFSYRLDRPAGVPYRVGSPIELNKHYVPSVTLPQGVRRALMEVS